ncbi:GNAT family N-acetyltransferase [Aquirufa ecclesiirivi]|uniref:GNAT family N-acetyltransferase n=1 Tax=Aquirufa ecclesiirivi TaxID=2715124 RepID=UPI0014085AD2|nr:GNAT family N-acetyltransferase [Aquirufa ecclesiirivi]NHC48148.1 GNAT family N-acetyltransferase [Aquirufa ecclesiirivi]
MEQISENQMKFVECTNFEEWDSFINNSPVASIFCTSSFLKSLIVDFEILVLKINGIIELGIVIFFDNQRNSILPSFSMYAGIIYREKNNKKGIFSEKYFEYFGYFLSQLTFRHRHLVFDLHHNFIDIRPISWFNYGGSQVFKFMPYYSGIVEIADLDFESYLRQISKSKYREYYKSTKLGLTFESSSSIKDLQILYLNTHKRQGITISEKLLAQIESIAHSAILNNYGVIYCVKNADGVIISSQLTIFFNDTAYFLIGGNMPECRHLFSSNFIILEMIKICIAKGIKYVDLCGMNSPNRSLTKSYYNTILKSYFQVRI